MDLSPSASTAGVKSGVGQNDTKSERRSAVDASNAARAAIGDWSIFRPTHFFGEHAPGRKHGPVPFASPCEHASTASRNGDDSSRVGGRAAIGRQGVARGKPPGPLRTIGGEHVRRMHGRIGSARKSISLASVLRENADRKGIVIYPPLIDWGWMRQRPQQLMAQFAKAGYLSQSSVRRGSGSIRFRDSCASPSGSICARRSIRCSTSRAHSAGRADRPLGDDPAVSLAAGDLRLSGQPERVVTGRDARPAQARTAPKTGCRRRRWCWPPPGGCTRRCWRFGRTHLLPQRRGLRSFSPADARGVPADIADIVAAGRPIIGYSGALADGSTIDLVARAAAARPDWEFRLDRRPISTAALGPQPALQIGRTSAGWAKKIRGIAGLHLPFRRGDDSVPGRTR